MTNGSVTSSVEWELSRTYDSGIGQVRWECFGESNRDSVVLLHGTPFSSFVWRGVARSLAQHFRVFVWDMPGYGKSAMFDGQDVSLAAQAKVFTELLDHWDLHEPLVVAHDFGGVVSLRAHLLHGATYSKLALVDAVALAPWGTDFFRLVRDNTEVFPQLPPALHHALVREYVSSASASGLRPGVLDKLTEPWLTDSGRAAFYRQIAQADQCYTDEVQDRYRDITIPTLVCWGAEDTWLPVQKGHELAAAIPPAQLQTVAGAGHLIQEDAPSELTATLLSFLHGWE